MKNNKLILIIAVLLGVAALVLIYTKSSSTLKSEQRDFAVKDTNAITKIFLADKTGKKALLERKSASSWTVNGKYRVRRDAILNLLEAIAGIDVKSPVGKAGHNTVIKDLASGAIKVEIYKGDDLVKTYYVGSASPDQMGTYMLLEDSSTPFIMYKPGFEGYLTPRFIVFESEWRDRKLFAYNEDEIKSIDVLYNDKPENSFRIVQDGKAFVLMPKNPTFNGAAIDQVKLRTFVSGFKLLGVEFYLTNTRGVKDSVQKAAPFVVINITDNKGIQTQLKLVHKANPGYMDDKGKLFPYDMEHVYTQLGANNEDVGALMYIHIDRFLKTPADFVLDPAKK